MPTFRKILQLQLPKPGEPLCSGMEFTTERGQHLYLSHYHTVVTVKNVRPRGWFGSATLALDCTVTINGRQYETQQFDIGPDDLGKTLFCAGFPCLTITGLDPDRGEITITQSEIVESCDPDSCPWTD
ncbi:hypothetical protein KF728_16925 [Candidatus Obscuribacterales bacterium]|jgi:hypothetical protein|nr:hypothetical protein [Candidatus Obscuribacterales bacterium]